MRLICTFLILLTSMPLLSVEGHQFRFDGDLKQGGLIKGQVTPGSKILFDGNPIKVGDKGHFVLGFGRDYKAVAFIKVSYPDGMSSKHELMISPREFDIERVDGLPPKTVSPPKSWLARRKIENGRVRKGRSFKTDELFWFWGFKKPAEGRFSGFYGSQRILNGKPRSPHYGLDIANKTGTPVTAPASGVVRLAASDFLLEGGIIIIDHGFGVTSTLFHLHSVDVKEGQFIEKGKAIGSIGSTGRSSGPHVDWRLNWGNVRLDPGLVIGLDKTK
ncbi:M23 family metallopeptidase [Temperatibacter marinus]|uniref:M23 family metallopeptidase n=1 Tax=Temperatibacter marinus TaxID=1456591 RepID=A0AA52EDC1_9PROT|nr:M23 family metallopeptidase [Temperatibacter marinus]WND01603.1 M23 family metallopeptidase [Temperatibacter marinus]